MFVVLTNKLKLFNDIFLKTIDQEGLKIIID